MSYYFRLATFSTLRETANVRPLLLARHGFCYDAARDTVRCAACEVEFEVENYECFSSSILERHRVKSPCCRFAHLALGPNIPSDLLGLTLPVGGHTSSDYGTQIGPNDRMWCTLRSAFDRATMRGVDLTNAGSNTEPSRSTSTPEEHAEPQVLIQYVCVYVCMSVPTSVFGLDMCKAEITLYFQIH